MKKFNVYDNGRPAKSSSFSKWKRGKSSNSDWANHSFASFEEAQQYADKWLGDYAAPLTVNQPYDYSGYGDLVEIREEEEV
jgi:hypothetical protein